jgi:hypothetical protein
MKMPPAETVKMKRKWTFLKSAGGPHATGQGGWQGWLQQRNAAFFADENL